MNIGIIGAGYVGLTTAAVLAELGHVVYCVDRDKEKVERLNTGIIPIYEPGLDELVDRHRAGNRLFFRHDVAETVRRNEVIMIAVGTPSAEDGSADLVYVRSVLNDIAGALNDSKVIIMKSTVPPGTGEWAESYLIEKGVPRAHFEVVSNPEFLREGTAIYDTFHPDRIVIGTHSAAAAGIVQSLYAGIEAKTILTGRTEAELIKYGSNAFLATKLSFINELARVCDTFGADIMDVARGIGKDSRIGEKFLQAGIGYGGSCLPKDVQALMAAAASHNEPLKLLQAVAEVNDTQLDAYVRKLEKVLGGLDETKHIAVWGATFKENTDDLRYSRAVALMEGLAKKACVLTAYDPLAAPPITGVEWKKSALDAVEGADAVIIATGWEEFIRADWEQVGKRMRGAVVLDGRNVLNRIAVKEAGLRYVGVGRL
ncbi:UDP-glucose/GDP-mannose dehydrogenase family protein [Paenibacillus sp. 1011MAR3C5]|uniref:UDP-glucose dehydrogenase family protein n=1 Tax=Paenibacillus sp. 1011MAR3C5 TaxID=1675787 RepID=UPI000E6BA6DC|nr:UDP-glucose/GDP-mannose dehydrogenase family protein [Paenibacillus sp. 1011MAR3C5]RJE89745.1 UDP-glucose/GDP-mannose dehydrogenase family protein [Paenibacillus sp. 1011MAR3C5]